MSRLSFYRLSWDGKRDRKNKKENRVPGAELSDKAVTESGDLSAPLYLSEGGREFKVRKRRMGIPDSWI